MAKTQWNDHLMAYRGSPYKVGDVVRFAQGQEARGYDVPAVLSLVALQYPLQAKATWGMASKSIEFARFEPNEMPFESGTYDQIKTIGRLTRNAAGDPLAAAMALMPDAHPGYGMPIGGVVALYNAVSPNFVGVDIACRMTGSTWQSTKANVAQVIEAIKKIGRFGFDPNEGRDAQDHPVMHDPLWNELPILRGLKAKAQAQLGTSGSGNHFIDWMEIVGRPGRYVLLTHSGSRGTGAAVAKYYEEIAKKVCPGKVPDGYWWLSMDSAEGQEYWAAMNLMGRYAQACHHLIHARFGIAAQDVVHSEYIWSAIPMRLDNPRTSVDVTATVDGVTQRVELSLIENHHNFAWEEEWPEAGKVYIHRKGATPLAKGQLGWIPGSSGSHSYLVQGTEGTPGQAWETEHLNSGSHGAGRPRSRSASKAIHDAAAYAQTTAQFAVQHDGVAPDETVFAYKDIEAVMAAQAGHVRKVAQLKPVFVKMGGLKGDDGD